MKMKTGKITALFLVSVLALAGTSMGYALWYDELYIDGYIETGEIEWVYTGSIAYMDPDYSIPDYHCNPEFEGGNWWQGDKDVGWTYAEITNDHLATIKLHNVYPCYFNMISLYMQVLGTIPVRIQSVTFESEYESVTIETGMPIFDLDLNGDGNPDIEFWWKDNFFGDQYHPSDYVEEISFWLHVMQPAPQDANLEFTISMQVVQWNEYQPPE